jgi:hypothetical protein
MDDLIVGAFLANTPYVIFGKIDNTAIYLSAIASGTGGFVINGEIGSGSDWSGQSVSTAGDVNGDGLDGTNNQIIQAITVDIACGGD